MNIWRSGFERNHGDKTVQLTPLRVGCNVETKQIIFASEAVLDFDGQSRHDWTVSLSFAEFQQMLAAVGISLEQNPNAMLTEEMAPVINTLVRLTYDAAQGVVTKPAS